MAPRIVILKLYAEARGLDPRILLQTHMQYLKVFQYWILERLELFGYFDVGVDAERHAELLGLRPDEVADAVDVVLEVFRSKPEDAALLPPLLTLPEKLAVLKAAASKLKEAFMRPGFLRSWLYVLHLAAPGGPTRLGRAVYKVLGRGREPGRAYVEVANRLNLLKWIIALEAAALDVGTKNELDALLAAYARFIPWLNPHVVYYAFRYMASDVKGISMAALAEPPEKIFKLLGQS